MALDQPINQVALIKLIKEQHQEILQKLIPEIDLHFVAVLHSDFKNQEETIHSAYRSFSKFVTLLTDHIYMEDEIVFPKLEHSDSVMLASITNFLDKHDNFEGMLHELLSEISQTLQPLFELMPFRILLLKMERLELLLAEHGALEDKLFVDFH